MSAKIPQPRAFPRPGDPTPTTGEEGTEAWESLDEAIAALDFLRDEWLAFGNRLGDFVAIADREERCHRTHAIDAHMRGQPSQGGVHMGVAR